MKKILSKTLSVITALFMTFNVAMAQPAPEMTICHFPPGNPANAQTITISSNAWPAHQAHGDHEGACGDAVQTPTCTAGATSQTYYSTDSDANLTVNSVAPVLVNPINGGWTASIPGASWIWSENPLTNGATQTDATFTQTLTIPGAPADGTLMVSADNTYEVSINGNPFQASADGDNFTNVDTYTIPASAFVSGANTITFHVTNLAGDNENTTGLENPAGLMYKLSVNCTPVTGGGNQCAEMTYMSDDADTNLKVDGHQAVAVSPINGGWTASIPGAEWVWSDATISDTTTSLTKTFTKTFTISGTPGDADLWIAADNSYKVSVNSHTNLFADAGEFNYTAAGQDHYVIPAADLNSGSNTITFEVTNMGLADSTMSSNPAGLMYKLVSGCDTDGNGNGGNTDECPIVYARVKFSTGMNGSRNWNTGSSTDANMDKMVYVGGNAPANTYGDAVWFPLTNPDGSFINDADIAPYRDIPGVAVQRMDGKIRLVLYGNHLDQSAGDVKELAAGSIELSNDQTPAKTRLTGAWVKPNGYVDPVDAYTRVHDVAVNDSANPMDARASFSGNINQYNERFDNVRVMSDLFQFHLVATTGSDGFYAAYNNPNAENSNCVGETACEPQPGMPVYARIKFATDPNSGFGVKNWGTGNLAKKIYVGGNTPADAYADGQWFMIYDGMNYVNDLDIAGYEDVPGLAVQRLNGKVRVVLHGSWTEPVGNDQANKERAQFTIQFSQDGSTVSPNVTPTSYTSDAANPLDFTAGKNTNDPQDDRVAIVGNSIQVKMVATTNDDGFYADYTHTAHGIPCIGEQNPQ
jgi:hypothetical protein